MRFQVIAQPTDQFDAWLRDQLAIPSKLNSSDAQRGGQLFGDRTCANCHTVMGTPAKERIGPDLTHIASRRRLAAGATEEHAENLGNGLPWPDRVNPSRNQPDITIGDEQAA